MLLITNRVVSKTIKLENLIPLQILIFIRLLKYKVAESPGIRQCVLSAMKLEGLLL